MTSNNQDNTIYKKNWFSTNIEYQGYGKATFKDPQVILEGHVQIRFDEFGNYNVEMDVENCNSEQPLRFGLIELFSADKPVKKNEILEFSPGLRLNECTSLVVTTSDGVYSSTGNIRYNPIFSLVLEGQEKVKFYPMTSQFDVNQERVAKYWVMPLFNYISEFQERKSILDNHPLRIGQRTGNLITFTFNNSLGFIEALSDLPKRKDILYSAQSQCIITAVIIGEVNSKSIDIEDVKKWIPSGFLSLLSLATGSEVANPWVEFRGANGELVRRIHNNFVAPIFSKGHKTISEVIHQGTGSLLTCAQSSQYYSKQPLGSVIFDLVQSSSDSLTIEDKLNKICRAFDYLCKHYKLDIQDLFLGLDLTHQEFVRDILKNAEENIRVHAKVGIDPEQSKLLIKIADKTINASNKDRDFGLAVTDLLKHFCLYDAVIIDSHYQSNPRPDGTRHWSGVISNYRGIVVHKGDFSFETETYDIHDVIRITYHLYDILVRIVFIMLGYNGTYQPIIVKGYAQMSVYWVKSDTSAEDLGYC